MKKQYGFFESEQSRKHIFFRRVVILIVFGLFFWQIAGGSLVAGAFAVSGSNSSSNSGVSNFCERSDFGCVVCNVIQSFSSGDVAVFENALLFGQAPCR